MVKLKSFKQHIQEGPQNTWTMLQHKMKTMKVSKLDAHHKSKALKLLKSVNTRSEVLLWHPREMNLLILQKKVVGRDIPDAPEWRIIEK